MVVSSGEWRRVEAIRTLPILLSFKPVAAQPASCCPAITITLLPFTIRVYNLPDTGDRTKVFAKHSIRCNRPSKHLELPARECYCAIQLCMGCCVLSTKRRSDLLYLFLNGNLRVFFRCSSCQCGIRHHFGSRTPDEACGAVIQQRKRRLHMYVRI